MHKTLAALLLLLPALACASPNWVVQVSEPIPGFSRDGLARVNIALPAGADLLAAEIGAKAITIHAALDPDAPMIWRVIELTPPGFPQLAPAERHIGLVRYRGRALHIWDLGEFTRPFPGAGR